MGLLLLLLRLLPLIIQLRPLPCTIAPGAVHARVGWLLRLWVLLLLLLLQRWLLLLLPQW